SSDVFSSDLHSWIVSCSGPDDVNFCSQLRQSPDGDCSLEEAAHRLRTNRYSKSGADEADDTRPLRRFLDDSWLEPGLAAVIQKFFIERRTKRARKKHEWFFR